MDQASAGKSRDAANNTGNAAVETWNAARTQHTGDKAIHRQAEHASCTTAETRAAEHSTGAVTKSAATEADADPTFYATSETNTGNEAGAAFESVHPTRAEQSVDASGDETEHADDSARAGARS